MTRTRHPWWILLAPWVWPITVGAQAPTAPASQPSPTSDLLAAVGVGFGLYRTDHFVMASNVPDALATGIGQWMELAYDQGVSFCRMLGVDPDRSGPPLETILFDDLDGYLRYADRQGAPAEGTAGFYDPGANRSAFWNAFNDGAVLSYRRKLDLLEESGALPRARLQQLRRALTIEARDALKMALRHELAHQVQHNIGLLRRDVATPVWLVEGLACLFEVDPAGARRGLVVNEHRLAHFHRGQAANGLFSLEALMAVQRVDPLMDPQRVELFYAQSWALCHYLVRHRPRQMAAYLSDIRSRPPGQTLDPSGEIARFEAVFGSIQRLERVFFRAMMQMGAKP